MDLQGHILLLQRKTEGGAVQGACGYTWKAKSLSALEGQASLARAAHWVRLWSRCSGEWAQSEAQVGSPRAREGLRASRQQRSRARNRAGRLSLWKMESQSLNSCKPAVNIFCQVLSFSLQCKAAKNKDSGGRTFPGLPTTPQGAVVMRIITRTNTHVGV